MSPTHVDADIATFVEDMVQAKVNDDELAVGDPALVNDICRALVKGANGMWVDPIYPSFSPTLGAY